MPEEGEEKRGFTVTDRRFSRRDSEEETAEARQEREPAAPADAGPASGEGPEAGSLPKADFSGFILSLANTALINMGAVPNPMGEKTEVHLEGARQMIDILGVLEEKTRGNLSEEEERLFEQVLSELRLRFIEAARAAGGGAAT